MDSFVNYGFLLKKKNPKQVQKNRHEIIEGVKSLYYFMPLKVAKIYPITLL